MNNGEELLDKILEWFCGVVGLLDCLPHPTTWDHRLVRTSSGNGLLRVVVVDWKSCHSWTNWNI